MSAPDNPLVFPRRITDRGGRDVGHDGITLRDYFAAHALAASHVAGVEAVSRDAADAITARRCYALADALLRERERAAAAELADALGRARADTDDEAPR